MTSAMHRLDAGDTIWVRGPFGRGFPVEKFRGKDMLFAPGGLGLAPLRSLINQVLDERALFGGSSFFTVPATLRSLLFKDELQSWASARPGTASNG